MKLSWNYFTPDVVDALSVHIMDLKIQRRDGDENVTLKVNLRAFSLYRNYS